MLLGRSGVGKSTVGNRILGREEFNINNSFLCAFSTQIRISKL
uniref:AIG1-type G domain-containing protein n=1 Tax=Erpetoichthys calabaricus TaxID=27687 RepID=A0A8C4SV75_ERPCA